MYTFCMVLIVLASLLLIVAVLVQNPKSGMAANFGAGNQVMGVRETSDFLEKTTWTLAVSIVVLSLCATLVMDRGKLENSNAALLRESTSVMEKMGGQSAMPNQVDLPALPAGGEQSAPEEKPAE